MSLRTLVIAVFLLAVAAGCPPADAQQPPKIAKIGVLLASNPAATVRNLAALRHGLRGLAMSKEKLSSWTFAMPRPEPNDFPSWRVR